MIKYGLKHEDIAWIEGVLSNDENSIDDELLVYFQVNGLTADQASEVVAHRSTYLNDLVFDGTGPLWDAL